MDSVKCLTDYLDCVRREDRKRLAEVYKAQLVEQTGSAGGYTVPDELSQEILGHTGPTAVLSRAMVLPMTRRELEVPYFDSGDSPAISDHSARFGNAAHYWMEESTTATEGEPDLALLRLLARELVCFFYLTSALDADMGEARKVMLQRGIGESALWEWERAFLVGNGATEPLGMLSSPAAISVSRAGANDISLVDLGKMLCRLTPDWDADGTIWVAHPSTLEKLIPLAAVTGIPNTSTRVSSPFFLLGLPLHFSECMKALGTAKDIALVDCRKYCIGLRQPHLLRASYDVAFVQRKVAWRFASRVAGAPWVQRTITPANGAATLSPFVYLT